LLTPHVEERANIVVDTLVNLLRDFWSGLIVGQIQQLGNWNYVLLALLTIIEGPIATLLAAVAASTGLLNPQWVFVAAATGNLTADALWYSLGYLGKTDWILQHGRRFGIRPGHVAYLERSMQTHARKILLVAKLTLSFAIPALIAAGMARVPWRRWFTTIAGAEVIWTGGLVLIGYHVTLSLRRMEQGLQVVAIAGISVFLALLIRQVIRYGSRVRFPPD
jgi:membrane protein DedA with SNARE-associated domain